MAIGDKKSAVMQSDIVNDFTTGGAKNVLSAEMGKTLAQRPNPNLLDNWYFADPVDQRGGWVVPPGKTYYITGSEVGGTTDKYYAATLVVESEDYSYWAITVNGATRYVTYADAVRGYTGTGYTIDRWSIYSTAQLSVKIETDGLLLTATGSNAILMQKVPVNLTGKKVRFSVLTDSGLYSGVKTVDALNYTSAVTIPGGAVEVFTSEENTVFRVWLKSAGASIKLIAAKLELGT